jgi:hypothetical protein
VKICQKIYINPGIDFCLFVSFVLKQKLDKDVFISSGQSVKRRFDSKHKYMYSEVYITKMLEIDDNIFAVVGNRVFKLSVGILLDTSCATFVANLFPYSYAVEDPVRIRVRIGPSHPLVCRTRRLNGDP